MAGNAAVVGILRVLLTANTASFDTALAKSAQNAKVFSRDMRSIGTQATQVGAALTKTLTVPLAGAAVGLAKVAMDFESSFAGVRKTVDASAAEFTQMAQQLRNLAKEIPVNVNELNRLAEAAGALGIPKTEIVDFARVMALLGVTTNVTSDQAAESIAKIQNIFQSTGKATDRFAAALVALGNDGQSTEGQILELANRIASAGNAVGLSQDQVLGFSAAIANVGIEAEAGGSAISRVFIEISQAVSRGGHAVSGFADVAGMSIAQFSEAFRTDAAGATTAFIEGLGRVTAAGGDLNRTLEQLGFTEIRQSNLLRSLALSGDNLSQALNLASLSWRENTALTEEAEKRFATTSDQLTLLWNRVKDVGITLGNALLPAIRTTAQVLGALTPYLEIAAQVFASLPGPVQAVGLGLVALVAAAGPVVYIFGQIALSAAALTSAFTAKGIATRLLTANVAGLTTALTVLRAPVTIAGIQATVTAGAFGLWSTATATLATTMRGLWAVLVANPIGVVVAAAGLAAVAFAKWRESAAAAALAAQEQGAKQDSINLAIKRGAEATVSYSEAVEYNNRYVTAQKEALDQAARAAVAFVGPLQNLQSLNTSLGTAIAAAEQELRGLSKTAKDDLVKAIKSGVFSIQELADASGLSERAVELLKRRLDDAGGSASQMAEAMAELISAGADVEATVAGINGTIVEAVRHYLEAGVSQRALATAYWLTDVQVKAIAQSMADENAMLEAGIENIERSREAREAATAAIANQVAGMRVLQDLSIQMGNTRMVGVDVKQSLTFAVPDMRQYARQTQQALQQALREPMAGTFSSFLRNDLGKVILGAVQGGGSVVKSIGASIGGQLGQSLLGDGTTGLGGFLSRKLGSTLGGALGSVIPGLGTLLGSVGGEMIGKLFGKLFGNPEKAINPIREAFVQANGGLDALNKKAAAAGLSLNRLLSAKNENQYKAAIDELNKAFDAHNAKLERAKALIDGLGPAFNGVVGAFSKEFEKFVGIAEKLASARAALKDATERGDRSAAAQAAEELLALQRQQTAEASAFNQQLDDLGIIAVASVGAALEAGYSLNEAIAMNRDGISQLRKAYADLGLEVDDAFLQSLFVQEEMQANNPSLVAGASSLGGAMSALAQLGRLNADTFAAMQRTGSAMYAKLQAEAEAAGGSTADALLPMQDYLREAEKRARELGIPLDENTQLMIDQSKELGIWKEAGKSANDLLLDGLQKIVDKMDEFLDRIAGVPPRVRTEVTTVYTTEGNPPTIRDPRGDNTILDAETGEPIVPPVAERGGRVTRRGIVPQLMALGGWAGIDWSPRGRDIIPALLRPNELVVTPEQQDNIRSHTSALVRQAAEGSGVADAGGAAGGSVTFAPQFHGLLVDGPSVRRVLDDVVFKELPGAILRNDSLRRAIHSA